jgi:hypothetical protein
LVQADAGGPGAAASGRGRDVDPAAARRAKIPEGRGAPVAEDRPLATGEHSREPPALSPQAAVADGVDAAMQPQQALSTTASSDGAVAEAEAAQLLPRHHPMLSVGKRRHRVVRLEFCSHTD